MTSRGCKMLRDAERVPPQLVTPVVLAQSQPQWVEVGMGYLLPQTRQAARFTLVLPRTEPQQASQRLQT